MFLSDDNFHFTFGHTVWAKTPMRFDKNSIFHTETSDKNCKMFQASMVLNYFAKEHQQKQIMQ